MIRYVVLTLLALLTMTFAVLEGLVESLPPQLIQISGLLTIVCAGVFIFLGTEDTGRRNSIKIGRFIMTRSPRQQIDYSDKFPSHGRKRRGLLLLLLGLSVFLQGCFIDRLITLRSQTCSFDEHFAVNS